MCQYHLCLGDANYSLLVSCVHASRSFFFHFRLLLARPRAKHKKGRIIRFSVLFALAWHHLCRRRVRVFCSCPIPANSFDRKLSTDSIKVQSNDNKKLREIRHVANALIISCRHHGQHMCTHRIHHDNNVKTCVENSNSLQVEFNFPIDFCSFFFAVNLTSDQRSNLSAGKPLNMVFCVRHTKDFDTDKTVNYGHTNTKGAMNAR